MFFLPVVGAGFVGGVANAETSAWVAAVVANGGTVSNPRKLLVDALITGLKTDSVWTKLDRLWLLAAENEGSALTDLVAASLATKVSTPTFTTNQGYEGEDSANPPKYINSNYNPAVNGVAFVQDSAHISAWSVGNVAPSAGGAVMGVHGVFTQTNLYDTYLDGNIYSRINDVTPSGSQGAPGTRAGQWIANRSGASATQSYQNGSLFSSPNAVSTAVINRPMFILCTNNEGPSSDGNPNQIAMASIGGSLTGTVAANFYNRLRTYMTAVGVP